MRWRTLKETKFSERLPSMHGVEQRVPEVLFMIGLATSGTLGLSPRVKQSLIRI